MDSDEPASPHDDADDSRHDPSPADERRASSIGPQPIHGQVRHQNLSARVPERIGEGVFANGVMVLSGQTEIVLDFILRMGEQQKIVARCLLPHLVARQFLMALQENVSNYERRFGRLPPIPMPSDHPENELRGDADRHVESQQSEPGAGSPPSEVPLSPDLHSPIPGTPKIEDIYDELKADDRIYAGSYANAALIRHSGTEFCLDFISNLFPRSTVSARVFLAAPHIRPLMRSLQQALQAPGTNEGFA